MAAELHQEEFILAIGCPQERSTASCALFIPRPHTVARIEYQPDGGRRVLAAKCVITCCTLSSKSVKCSFSRPTSPGRCHR